MPAEAMTSERITPTREMEFLDDKVFDFLDSAWESSTPRLLFSAWLKHSLATQERLGGAHWIKQYQLYKAEATKMIKGVITTPAIVRRFVLLAIEPEHLPAANDTSPDADRRFREHSRVFFCHFRLNDDGKIADFIRPNQS